MGEANVVKGAANEADVVAGATASACLRHKDSEAVGIVFTRQDGLHNLTDRGDRGEAGVVVDEFQACINSGAIVVIKNDDVIAVLFEYGCEDVEVYRAHLRRDDRIALVAHFLGKFGAAVGGHSGGAVVFRAIAHFHSRDKASDSDADGAEVVDLIDLEESIELACPGEDLGHLIGGDGIKAATEGGELNKLKVGTPADELGGGIESGVIDPLIDDAQGARGGKGVIYSVLGEHVEAV